jgi:hypothetical protein
MMTPDEEKLLRISLETLLKPFTQGLNNLTDPTAKRLGVIIASMLTDQMRNAVRVYWRSLYRGCSRRQFNTPFIPLRDKNRPICEFWRNSIDLYERIEQGSL